MSGPRSASVELRPVIEERALFLAPTAVATAFPFDSEKAFALGTIFVARGRRRDPADPESAQGCDFKKGVRMAGGLRPGVSQHDVVHIGETPKPERRLGDRLEVGDVVGQSRRDAGRAGARRTAPSTLTGASRRRCSQHCAWAMPRSSTNTSVARASRPRRRWPGQRSDARTQCKLARGIRRDVRRCVTTNLNLPMRRAAS